MPSILAFAIPFQLRKETRNVLCQLEIAVTGPSAMIVVKKFSHKRKPSLTAEVKAVSVNRSSRDTLVFGLKRARVDRTSMDH
jgi:hypothetical protein